MTSHAHEVPGPVAEEAARLVEALSEWARGHVGDAAAGVGTSAECRICPVCQGLTLLRHARPETFAHLLEASAAMTAALRSLVENGVGGGSRAGGVERITLDDDMTAP
jgi:hypothetical protein